MRSGRAGWTRAGLIAILTAGLIFSFIRSAWLGTMAAVFLVGWTYGRGTAVRAVIGLAAIVMAVGLADPAVQKRFLSMTDLKNPETDMSAQSNVERLRTWRVATEVIRDHPYLGVGGGNFRTAFDEHRAAFDVRSRPHAHNNLLQQTAEYGIPGGMAFVAVWCVFFGEAWKGWRRIRDPVAGFRLVGAAAAVAGFLTAGLFESNFGDSEVAMMMWLMVGIAMWETKRWTTAH
jgi:putative inorganic carbon (HCO3(-)) transporter